MQLGNETAPLNAIESRLREESNPVAQLLEEARKKVDDSRDKEQKDYSKGLNNLLTSFYIKPGAGDKTGSIEFVHKSFGEFLFAEKLKDSLESWLQASPRRPKNFNINDEQLQKQIYDLLGYGALTPEIIEYLTGMLYQIEEFDFVSLFTRLNDFYKLWHKGEFIDGEDIILPHQKMRKLNKALNKSSSIGLRQVDVYTGLNVMILLLELHRYGQKSRNLQDKLTFYPCGEPSAEGKLEDPKLLYRLIGYSNCIGTDGFTTTLGNFLSDANLCYANLKVTIRLN